MMNEDMIVNELITIIDNYGTNVLKTPERLKGMLSDMFPKEEKTISLIYSVLKEGIGEDLLRVKNDTQAKQKECIDRCKYKLKNNTNFSEEAINSALRILAESLGIRIKPENKTKTDNNKRLTMVIAAVCTLAVIVALSVLLIKDNNPSENSSIETETSYTFDNNIADNGISSGIIYDENGIKIEYLGSEIKSEYGYPKLKLNYRISNDNGSDVYIDTSDSELCGLKTEYYCGMSCGANEKNKEESVDIPVNAFEYIDNQAEMIMKNTYKLTSTALSPIVAFTESTTLRVCDFISSLPQKQNQNFEIFDENGMKICIAGIDIIRQNDIQGEIVLTFVCENDSTENLMMKFDSEISKKDIYSPCFNGEAAFGNCNLPFSIEPGKSGITYFHLSYSPDENGIKATNNIISFYPILEVLGSNGWKTDNVLKSSPINIHFDQNGIIESVDGKPEIDKEKYEYAIS